MKISKPVAVQLFSLRDDLGKDFYGTLQAVAQMGYDGVEFAAFFGQPADKIRAALDEYGLTAISSHVSLDRLENDFEKELEIHKTLGCKYIAIPYADGDHDPRGPLFENALKSYAEIGKKLKENGIGLLYHNHDFEFADYRGECGLDYMYDHTPAEYFAPELDICWAKVAGKEPVDYIRKYQGRMKVIHLKDFQMNENSPKDDLYALIDNDGMVDEKADEKKDNGFSFVPVGYGQQDMPAVLSACEECGIEWYIVEQDSSIGRPPLEAAKMSVEYLKK